MGDCNGDAKDEGTSYQLRIPNIKCYIWVYTYVCVCALCLWNISVIGAFWNDLLFVFVLFFILNNGTRLWKYKNIRHIWQHAGTSESVDGKVMFLTILTEEFLFYSVNEKICVSGSLFLFLHLFIYLFIFDWMHLSCYSVDAGNVILFFQVFVNRKRLTAKANAWHIWQSTLL